MSLKESEEYSQNIGACGAFEVSAKEGLGINELFKEIAKVMNEQLLGEQEN